MGKASDFLTQFDNFGKPIGLTYKSKGAMATPCGGLGSIATFLFFVAWFAIEIWEVYMNPGKFGTGSSRSLTQMADGSYPLWTLNGEDFFVTYRLWTFNDTLRPDLDKYVSGLWVQRSTKNASAIYKGRKCEETYGEFDYSPQFMSQIKGQWCADTQGNSTYLQKPNPMNASSPEHDFFFVVDFCKHFKNYTGRNDCKSI